MWKNKFKTVFLLVVMTGLMLSIGGFVAGTAGIFVAMIMACLFNGLAYFFSEKIVLSLYKARPLESERHQYIVGMVTELAQQYKLPMPRLWIIDQDAANAFATGRSPEHSSIVLTTGIIALLEPYELRGVLAHELAHIYNRDILVSTVAATVATAISYLAHMVQNMLWWNALSGDRRQKNGGNIIGALVVAIVVPLAATIVQLSISRTREYLADELGGKTCRDPLALAGALRKLANQGRQAAEHQETAHAATAHLFIVTPLRCSTKLQELFSTHPPLEKRIERLYRQHEQNF